MRAISLWQPWASLLVLGIKRFETRNYPFPRSLRGQRVAIHAAKHREPMDEHFTRLVADTPLAGRLIEYGAIVGTVEFKNAFQIGSHIEGTPCALWDVSELVARRCPASVDVELESALGDFRLSRWAWEVGRPHALIRPIPYSGRQGFFDISDAEALSALDAATASDPLHPEYPWRQEINATWQPAITRGEITRPIFTTKGTV